MADTPKLMSFDIRGTTISLTHSTQEAMFETLIEANTAGRGQAVATINLDHLVKLYENKLFRQAYAAQDIVVADGNPIVWLSKLAGRPVSLVTGSDSLGPACEKAAALGWRVAFVGATDDTLAAAREALVALYPALNVTLMIAPPMGFDPLGSDARAIHDQLREAEIDLCILALGAPKQEIFAAFGRGIAPKTSFLSIGASLDFYAGRQQRAPQWVRKVKMEWLWRMLSDPMRLVPRYAKCAALLPWLAVQALFLR